MDILEIVELLKEEVYSIYSHLHSIPESQRIKKLQNL